MSFLPAVAGVAAKALPIVGKVASALPMVGNVVKGIGKAVGGIFGGGGGGQQQQVPSRGTGYGARFGEGMSNMHAIGQDAWNTGRSTFMRARDAFRGGDFAGGIGRIAQGIGHMADLGGMAYHQGRNMYQAARGFGNEMGQAFSGIRQSFGQGDFGGGISGIGGIADRISGFGRGMQSGYGMAGMMRRGRRFGGGMGGY